PVVCLAAIDRHPLIGIAGLARLADCIRHASGANDHGCNHLLRVLLQLCGHFRHRQTHGNVADPRTDQCDRPALDWPGGTGYCPQWSKDDKINIISKNFMSLSVTFRSFGRPSGAAWPPCLLARHAGRRYPQGFIKGKYMFRHIALAALAVSSLTACQNMNVAGMVGAASSLFQAATVSDEQIQALAVSSQQKLDSQNRIASANSKYATRLARVTRGL